MSQYVPVPGASSPSRACARAIGAVFLTLALPVAQAGSANWSSTNVQYLYGTQYELGDSTRSVITLEHVNGWKYGDNFFFLDVTNADRQGDDTGTELYAELSPRLSLSALSGRDLSAGPIKDVLLTSTLEMGNGFTNYLYGLAVDLTIPKMPVAQINYYVRQENGSGNDIGSQVTLVWLLPFAIGSTSWSFEGFFDYAWGNDPKEDNIITAPRLLLDVGKFFGSPGTLQAGIEYQIWRNKFGIKGVDEDVAQAMLKWIW